MSGSSHLYVLFLGLSAEWQQIYPHQFPSTVHQIHNKCALLVFFSAIFICRYLTISSILNEVLFLYYFSSFGVVLGHSSLPTQLIFSVYEVVQLS